MADTGHAGAATLEPGQVRVAGRVVTFALDDPEDVVQKKLWHNTLYEGQVLPTHADLVHHRSTVLDVGANVGNHSVFYALRTRAHRVYPFEPNPRSIDLLRRTVEQNDLGGIIDTRHLGSGVGSETGELFVHAPRKGNLGRTILRRQGTVAVPVRRLDDMAVEGEVSLVKIDVEGMELEVLAGAEALIADQRPGIAIEVDNVNRFGFWAWADAHDYHVVHALRMYAENVNYLCVPRF